MSAPAGGETGLFLEGLRCAGCVARIEETLLRAPGVLEASVNLTTRRALVRFDASRTSPGDLAERVRALGYDAAPFDPGALERPALQESRRALARVLVAGFLATNVMMISAALYIGEREGMEAGIRNGLRWIAIALSLPAVFGCALPFWRGALTGLRRREISMDVPIVLGIATAFGASVAGTLVGTSHVFMDSAATIVFLILLGRTLERNARARSAGSIERLLALLPRTAHRVSREGVRVVPVDELRVGDRVIVAPGQSFPADGRLRSDATEVDESLLTGETRPVLREAGDPVVGGSRNLLREVEVEVDAPVTEGTVARLSALLEWAQSQRPRVQQLADRVARVFAPTLLAVAAGTAIAWLLRGAAPLDVALTTAAVLIVACPCALGLATPAAITAAIGRAAALGVLVKSGEALERCARVDHALLDKTGTVSEGRLRLEAVAAADGSSEDEVLLAAAVAEGASAHPFAEAIRMELERRRLPVPERDADRSALPGRGVIAETGEGVLRVGAQAWIRESASLPPDLAERASKWASRGASLAFVARDAAVLGALAFVDPPRPDAPDAIRRLGKLGVSVSLVSGDHPAAVSLAAERAGVAAFEAQVLPEGKVERVRELRAGGRVVLAAGDGINDAGALAASDVGVAMARGSDVALHAADLVVRTPRLGALPDLILLARATLHRIRENLGLALVYNAVAVPLAVAGRLEPLHAAIAMSLSSLAVTLNAIRLLGWKPAR